MAVQPNIPDINPLVWVESCVKSFIEIPLTNCYRYKAIELQRLQVGDVTGFLAVLYLHNGSVCLLHENHLPLDWRWAMTDPAMSGMEVSIIQEFAHICIKKYSLDVETAEVHGEFQDNHGSLISLNIETVWNTSPKPLFTPAPHFKEKKKTAGLRFLQLDFFSLLPISSDIDIEIDGRKQLPTAFLLPAFLARYSSTRVGFDLLLANLHVRGVDTQLPDTPYSDLLAITPGDERIGDHQRWFRVSHTPSIVGLNDRVEVSGRIKIHSELGVVASGKYSFEKIDNTYKYLVHSVRQNWFPGFFPLTRFCLYWLRRLRRNTKFWSAP